MAPRSRKHSCSAFARSRVAGPLRVPIAGLACRYVGGGSAMTTMRPSSSADQPDLRVFVSYRRDDCAIHAGRLVDNLRDRVGADVFLDIDTIGLGENFLRRIE